LGNWVTNFGYFSEFQLPNYSITKLLNVLRATMQVFHIRYRNEQGALMRILNAISRRGLDLTSVHAEATGQHHLVTLQLEASQKQIGQLAREWHSIVDVVEVRSAVSLQEHEAAWAAHPPASAGLGGQAARAALA
jgi:acetolactate synthase regulatory subunit